MGARAELRTPNRNKRGERTRSELLDAAWRVVDRMSLVDLLASLTPIAVATEAGVTTGAFRHHFEDPDDLVQAMVAHHLATEDQDDLIQVATEVSGGRNFDAASVRAFAVEVWEREMSPGEARHRRRRLLLSVHAPETTLQTGEQLTDLLVDGFWRPYFELSGPIVDQALGAIDRVPIPPFRTEDVVRLVRAVLDGLVAQSTLEPGVIDARLYADALTGVLVTLTGPAGRAESLADLAASLRVPSRRSDVAGLEEMQSLAVSALELFDRNVERVTFSELASAIGRPIDLLVGTYGTVRRMAAIAFAAVLPRVEESSARYLATDPMRTLADILCDVARMAQQHPHVAAALLFERSEQAILPAPGPVWAGTSADIHVAVPITNGLVRALAELPGLGRLDATSLAADMVDLTLLYAGTRASWAPAEVARRALSQLPF